MAALGERNLREVKAAQSLQSDTRLGLGEGAGQSPSCSQVT